MVKTRIPSEAPAAGCCSRARLECSILNSGVFHPKPLPVTWIKATEISWITWSSNEKNHLPTLSSARWHLEWLTGCNLHTVYTFPTPVFVLGSPDAIYRSSVSGMCKKFKQELLRQSIYLDRFYTSTIMNRMFLGGDILVEDLMARGFPCLISLTVMKTLFPSELFKRVGEKRELLQKRLCHPSPSKKLRLPPPMRRQRRRQQLLGHRRRVVAQKRERVRRRGWLGLSAQGTASFPWEISSVKDTQYLAILALQQRLCLFLFLFLDNILTYLSWLGGSGL